ncbi:hypothetical protein BDZ89DRAFT_1057827 [Hymenopellis radicata]|nr:hypothetical protein BDZ89DRAFT_1057827 [Hymenopellis radicata]
MTTISFLALNASLPYYTGTHPNSSRRTPRQRSTATRLYDPVRQAALEALIASPRSATPPRGHDEQLASLPNGTATVSGPAASRSSISDGDLAVSIALLSRASTPMRRPQTSERPSSSSSVAQHARDAIPDIIQDLSNINEEMATARPVASSSRLDDTQIVPFSDSAPTRTIPSMSDTESAPPSVAIDQATPPGQSSAVSQYLEFCRTSEDFGLIVNAFVDLWLDANKARFDRELEVTWPGNGKTSTASVLWERMFKCYLLRHNEYQSPVVTWGSIKHMLILWKVEVPHLLRIRVGVLVAFLRLNATRIDTVGSVSIPGKREEVRILTAWKMWARVVRKDQRLLKCTCVRDYAASRLARVFTQQLDLGGMRRPLERMSYEIHTLAYPCRRQLLFL